MRLYGIDLLRGVAAFGIVGCHLCLSPRTAVGEVVTHFCDMNVAVFGLLAGYFTHVVSGGGGILRRVGRLVPMYVVWTIIFLVFSFLFKVVGHDDLGQYGEMGFWVGVVFRGNASCHLWFLIVLLYTQVIILLVMGRGKVPRVVPWILGILGIGVSVMSRNWWCLYFARLWGFVWLGVALQGVTRGTAGLYFGGALIGAVLHVILKGVVPGFILDGVVAVPLVLGAARVKIGEGQVRVCAVAKVLGATSLGVYLVHPLLTRVGSVIVGKVCAAPYGIGVVVADWILCAGVAFLFAVVARRIPYVRRVVE